MIFIKKYGTIIKNEKEGSYMKNIKRFFSIFIAVMLAFALCACNDEPVIPKSDKTFTELAVDGLGITFSYPEVWEIQGQASDGAAFFYGEELVGMYIRKLDISEGLAFEDITNNTRYTILGKYTQPAEITEDKTFKIDGRDACLFTYYDGATINPVHYTMVLILDAAGNAGYQIEISSTEASAEVARADFEDVINSIKFN